MNYGVVTATTQVISLYEQQHKSIQVIDGQTSDLNVCVRQIIADREVETAS
jgi:hypothetical protein